MQTTAVTRTASLEPGVTLHQARHVGIFATYLLVLPATTGTPTRAVVRKSNKRTIEEL